MYLNCETETFKRQLKLVQRMKQDMVKKFGAKQKTYFHSLIRDDGMNYQLSRKVILKLLKNLKA